MGSKTNTDWILTLSVTKTSSIPPLTKDATPIAIDIYNWTLTLKNDRSSTREWTYGNIALYPDSARSDVITDDGSDFNNETITVPSYIASRATLTFSGTLKMKHQSNGSPYNERKVTFKAKALNKTTFYVTETITVPAIPTTPISITPSTESTITPGNTVRFSIVSSSPDYFYRLKIDGVWFNNGAYFGPASANTTITTPWATITNEMAQKAKYDFSPYTGPRYFGTYESNTAFKREDGTYAPHDPTALYFTIYDEDPDDNILPYAFTATDNKYHLLNISGSIPVEVYTYYKNQQEDYLISRGFKTLSHRIRVKFPTDAAYAPSYSSFTVDLKQYLKDNNTYYAVSGNDSANYVVSRAKPILEGDPGLNADFEGFYYQYTTDSNPTSASEWHDIYFDSEGYTNFPDVVGIALSQTVTFRARAITSRMQVLPVPVADRKAFTEFKYTGPEISNVNISRAPTQRGTNMSIGYTLSLAALGGHNASNVDLYFKRSRVGSTYPTIPDVSHLTLGSDNTVIIQNGISTRLKDDAYTLLTSKPGDWATTYTRYYTRSENPTTHEVTYTPNASGSWRTNTYYEYTGFDITSIYDVRLVLTDAYGADTEDGYLYKKIFETTLRSSFELVNFAAGGTSLSFGMISSNNENEFECALTAKFLNEFECALTAKFLSDVICGGKKLIFNDDNTVTWANA